eukprot:9473783-Pyramimonas_sp.AAC.1
MYKTRGIVRMLSTSRPTARHCHVLASRTAQRTTSLDCSIPSTDHDLTMYDLRKTKLFSLVEACLTTTFNRYANFHGMEQTSLRNAGGRMRTAVGTAVVS